MRLTLRYDMRAPAIGAPAEELYQTSVEQVAWADDLGFDTVYLAEHHGAEDGYCPAPIVQASAMAGRSKGIRLHFSALLAVLHHPLRLAEDLAVLDLISGGRVEATLGIGYRPHEYEMMGVKKARRVPILEETFHGAGAGLDRGAVRVPRRHRGGSADARAEAPAAPLHRGVERGVGLPRRPSGRQLLPGRAGSP